MDELPLLSSTWTVLTLLFPLSQTPPSLARVGHPGRGGRAHCIGPCLLATTGSLPGLAGADADAQGDSAIGVSGEGAS